MVQILRVLDTSKAVYNLSIFWVLLFPESLAFTPELYLLDPQAKKYTFSTKNATPSIKEN